MNKPRHTPAFVVSVRRTAVAVVFTSSAVVCAPSPALAQAEAPPPDPAPLEAPAAEGAPPEAAEPAGPASQAAPSAQPPAPEPEASAESAAADPVVKPKPPPYAIPFQLRPVLAVNVVRSDTAIAFYKPSSVTGIDDSGTTVASMLLFSHKVAEGLAPMIRIGVVSNSPPSGESATNFLNPAVGVTYALNPLPPLRIGLFLGLTAPIGSGGGNEAGAENIAANGAGILARSAMDNAMFAVNYFTVFPGAGIAYVDGGFTAQLEATLLQLTRVRGKDSEAVDDSRTNFTAGVHFGYFVAPFASIGAELRHQRWLSTPQGVENDTTDTLRDNTTVAFGPRFHVQLAEKTWLRPALSLGLPIDDPMKDREYKIVQIDVPLIF